MQMQMKIWTRRSLLVLLALAALVLGASSEAAAQGRCVRHLAYLDLITGGTVDTTGPGGALEIMNLEKFSSDQCQRQNWYRAVVKVDIPPQCSRAVVWLDYDGAPAGWTLDIGDSETNDGYGGDAGTLPAGQNAEVQVLNQALTVYSAADNPGDVDELVHQQLGLEEGALRFTIADQALTWGQPFHRMATPDLGRLFFLPDDPVEPGNRTVYVGINRVVGNASRTGCGVSKAMVMFE